MCLILGIHHMRHTSLDVTEQTMLRCHIAVAHQRYTVVVELNNPMNHIPTAIHPCQHYVADINYTPWAMQDDALFAPDDKRQHAVAIHG